MIVKMTKKIKILLVDDDNPTREMYAEVFRLANFDVLEAKDGIEGMDIATKNIPDIIFTGIIMPRMDGFSMMQELKKIVSTSGIPIVISSHLGREEDQRRAIELGARDFIVRDITSPKQVVEKIKILFSGSGKYQIEFNPYSFDAQKMAKNLGLNDNFQCMECDEKMILEINVVDAQKRTFEAGLVCPNCGWKLK